MSIVVSMGCRLIIRTLNNNAPLANINISINDNNSNIVALLAPDGNNLASNITNASGELECYINAEDYAAPLTVSATSPLGNRTETIPSLANNNIPVMINFGAASGAQTKTISGIFKEFPFNMPINQINGNITLRVKINKMFHNLILTINGNNANLFNQTSTNGVTWGAYFDNGTFGFNLIIPAGVSVTRCKIRINTQVGATNYSLTHSNNLPAGINGYTNESILPQEDFELDNPLAQQLVIPFYHPRRDYSFTANLVRFPVQQLILDQHNATLSFNHSYINAAGSQVNTNFNIHFDNPNCQRANNQANPLLAPTETSFNFNNGNYEFTLYDIIGEINNLQVKIDYYGSKTHIGRNNGHPIAVLNFNINSPLPPQNLIPINPLNNNNIIIPLNGWENGFCVTPSREENTTVEDYNFNGHIMPMIHISNHEHCFNDLNFEISAPNLHYNNANKEDMGFTVNIYIYDQNSNPVNVQMNNSWAAGKRARTNPIHSLDITNLPNQGLFLPVHMDPLPNTIQLNRENLIINPKNNIATFNLGLDFLDENNTPMLGTFFVLAEVVPFHFINIPRNNNVEIDSIGHPEYALYILEVIS